MRLAFVLALALALGLGLDAAPTNSMALKRDLDSLRVAVSNSAGFYVSAADTNRWNAAYGWGNHASAGYLTSFTEADPFFTAWRDTNTYVKTEADPVFSAWAGTNTYVKVELDATALGVIATQKISRIELDGRIIDATGGVWQVTQGYVTNWYFYEAYNNITTALPSLSYPLPENFYVTADRLGSFYFEISCTTDLPGYDHYGMVRVDLWVGGGTTEFWGNIDPLQGLSGTVVDGEYNEYPAGLFWKAEPTGGLATNHVGTIALESVGDHASLAHLDWTATGHYGTPARLAGFFEGGMAGYSALGYGLYFDGSDNLTVSNEIVAGAALGATALQPSATNELVTQSELALKADKATTLTINGVSGNLSTNNVFPLPPKVMGGFSYYSFTSISLSTPLPVDTNIVVYYSIPVTEINLSGGVSIDASAGTVIVPSAGVYAVSYSVSGYFCTGTALKRVGIAKNGEKISYAPLLMRISTSNLFLPYSQTEYFTLNAGDALSLWLDSNGGGGGSATTWHWNSAQLEVVKLN